MTGNFLFEVVKLKLSGKRVCVSPRRAIEYDWGYRAAQTLFSEKDIVRKKDFILIWWDGLGAAMAQYPKMYCVWLTKNLSGFCGNNVQLYYWRKGSHSPKCKFCGIKDEHTPHISWCEEPGQDSLFKIWYAKFTPGWWQS
jgi:hypothetical protein